MPLQPRPYTVSASYARKRTLTAVGLFIVAIAVFIGAGWFISYQTKSIHEDERIWATGVYASDSHVSGRSTSHSFIINDYDLDTTYTDASGTSHVGKESFALLVDSISSGALVELKYDPQNPKLHTVSWAVEHKTGRWAFVAFMGIIGGGLFGLGSLAGAMRNLRQLGDARRVAARSDEVALEVVSMKPVMVRNRHTGNLYVFKHTVLGREKQLKQQLPANDLPMFTDERRTHLVALVSQEAPERPWIMRADRSPFV